MISSGEDLNKDPELIRIFSKCSLEMVPIITLISVRGEIRGGAEQEGLIISRIPSDFSDFNSINTLLIKEFWIVYQEK